MKILETLFLTILLFGCNYSNSKPSTNPPTQTMLLCKQLRHDIAQLPFTPKQASPNTDSLTKKTNIYQLQYDKYNCGGVE